MKNLQSKTVSEENAYEIWAAPGWKWYVLKKWQADDNKPYGRWFCKVYSPFCPEGEYGDTYVSDIKKVAIRVK
jgi:hypothetical protein